MFESPQQLSGKLVETGYFIDSVMTKVVFLAIILRKPILLEGPAGSGKTQLAVSLARAARTNVERLQCYPGITDKQVIGEFDQGLQRLYMEFCKDKGMPWEEIIETLAGRKFYRPRAVMRAFERSSPCVLLVDELDKVSEEIEAMLLEAFSAWQLSIPELGTIEATSIPVVIITSNEERRLGDPIRRRCLYIRVEHPTLDREAEIIANRIPASTPEFHREIAGLARAFRNYSLEKPPSVSEILDTALALQALGLNSITPEDRDWLLPFLAKTEKDRRHLLLREGFNSLIADGARYAQEIRDSKEVPA
jgi:MoxR-like ATPase